MPPNGYVHFSSRGTDIDFYDIVWQVLGLPGWALYILNFEFSHNLILWAQISFSTADAQVSVTR